VVDETVNMANGVQTDLKRAFNGKCYVSSGEPVLTNNLTNETWGFDLNTTAWTKVAPNP
jgi:hypothetical protein